MLRRKPTRQELNQTDNDELDQIRREYQEQEAAKAAANNTPVPHVTEQTAREKAIEGQSVRERLGLPSKMPDH